MSPFHLFELTLAFVFGIGVPVGCYYAWVCGCISFADWMEARRQRAAYKNQQGPYTHCELFAVPNQRLLGVRLYRNDAMVYETSADKP